MDDLNLAEALGQVSASEAGVIFHNFLRGGVRQMICEVMAAEVTLNQRAGTVGNVQLNHYDRTIGEHAVVATRKWISQMLGTTQK